MVGEGALIICHRMRKRFSATDYCIQAKIFNEYGGVVEFSLRDF